MCLRPAGRVVPVCALGMQVRTGPDLVASTSLLLLDPFWGAEGGGRKKIPSFNLSSLSPVLIMTPHFLFFTVFFFFPLDLVLLIPFLYLPLPSSFFVSKYNQERGKLEGDLVLCPSARPRGMRQGNTGLLPGLGWGPGLPARSWELMLRVAGPFWLPGAPWPQPMGFLQSNSQTPSFSEKKTFLPVTTE